MSGKQYLKNQLAVILINLLGMLALALFLIASGNNIQTVLFILVVWLLVLASCLLFFFFTRKKALDRLLNMAEQLEERYLLPEIMQEPERADEQVFYQIMKMAEKSMLEQIGEVQRERKEYKEYIEQWIHEVKTPITAMKLICENNRCSFTRELMAELENMLRDCLSYLSGAVYSLWAYIFRQRRQCLCARQIFLYLCHCLLCGNFVPLGINDHYRPRVSEPEPGAHLSAHALSDGGDCDSNCTA